MSTEVIEKKGIRYLAGLKGNSLINKESDIMVLMSSLYEKNADRVLLYKDNLPSGFVSLGTGVAGMVLNKFMTYKLKLAVVVDEEDINIGKFSELVTEVNIHNNLFHVFSDAIEAEKWLIK
jgi:hypothetical protein